MTYLDALQSHDTRKEGVRIALSRPEITPADIEAVSSVLCGPRLSLGPMLREFEQRFAEYVGTPYAAAVSSGTAALHLALLVLELEPDDEVITTPFSFIASANCILMAGAHPVFVDIDAETWNLDVTAIQRAITSKTRAVLPVHVFGQPARMDVIQDIAVNEGLTIIEDACESIGARYQERPAGSFGEVAAFGFYPNKQITTGEGGMLVTHQESIVNLVRSLRNQGRDHMSRWLVHSRMGYNYRMSEINAALGLSQLGRIDSIIRRRTKVAECYRERLKSESRVVLQNVDSQAHVSFCFFVIRLADQYTQQDRDRIMKQMHDRGIECSNYFTPIHLQPFYTRRFGYCPDEFPRCEHVAARTIALPFHTQLTEAEIDEVCEVLGALL